MRPTNILKLLALCFLLGISCKKDPIEQSKVDFEKFKSYITNYPTRPVSRCRDVSVYLGFELAEGTSLPAGLFDISPPIGGNYELSRNRKRISIINAQIKHNTQYQVKFNIGKLTEMPAGMNTFSFPMEAERQAWDLEVSPPTNTSMEKVVYKGTVKYGVCEPDKLVLERSLTALQEGKSLRIGWDHNGKNSRQSDFTIYDVERKDITGKVNLTLSMDALNVDDKGEMQLVVPSKSDFSFHAFKLIDDDKSLELYFTDPLEPNQDLSGLIKIPGRKISRTKIYQNRVNVYFENVQFGEYNLEILPGIKNLAGYPLKDSYTKPVFFKPPAPRVSIAEKGNILPPGDRWELPVSMITATGFRLRILKVYESNIPRFYQENATPFEGQSGLENIGRIELDTIYAFKKATPYTESFHSISLDRLVRREPGALYKILLTVPEEHNAFPCQEKTGEERIDRYDRVDFDRPWISLGYNSDYYEDDYNYGRYYNNNIGRRRYGEGSDLYNGQDPCNHDFTQRTHDSRLLMCSDVAIVAKSETEKNSYFFYVSKISDASPISNAQVTLKDIQGQNIKSGYTDSRGMLDVRVGDRKPFLAVAKYSGQQTYMPIQDAKSLSLSTFQVEGKKWKGDRKVFFYGERDVWRPGDSIYMHSIVFSPEKVLPPTLPVQLRLLDPTNKLVKEWTVKKNLDGIYDLRFVSESEAPTGYWRLEMKVGGATYKTPIRIETIRPNRLKMQMDFAAEKLLKKDDDKSADINVKWMHGLDAKDLKVEVEMLQKSIANPFSADYKNYVFNDIQKRYSTFLGMIKSGQTDKTGKLDFDIKTSADNSYPSMMLFNFDLRSFEKGGAFSSDMKSIKYSPYTHYVGAKFPGGNSGTDIYIKDTEAIMLAALDQDGKRAQRTVHISLYEIDYNWWYQFGNKGDYAAISNNLGNLKEEYDVEVGKNGKSISFKNYGRFLLKIEDKKSGHSISRVIYNYGDRWNDSEEVSQLEVLPLNLEKVEYKVGEVASFKLPPGPKGKYLITLENGGRIVHKETRSTSDQPIEVSLAITPRMAPTVYLHVHLMQAWEEYKNDRPLRLFGIKPLKVYDSATVLEPRIEMPEVLKTDEQFTVKVKEQNGKRMSYSLAIVDEGLLDITQFKTPDPWSAFFGKESLNVRTWDMYRDIFQRFLGEYTSLLAVGGDGSNAIAPSAKAKRFKPVVKFLGPFTLQANEEKNHSLTIKDYVGSVRAMVVSTDGQALGRYEQTSEVKKPLMLYSTLPRVLGPDEKLKVPVTVFSMDKNIKNVTATIKVGDHIKVVGESTQNIFFEKEGEKDIYFEIETASNIGFSDVEVVVKSGNHTHREKIEIDLRPSADAFTKTYQAIIPKGSTKDLIYEPFGLEGTRSGNITVSKGLNFSFVPHVEWLSKYPHGCLEQTVSRVFPQVYLYKMNLLDEADKLKYRQQFEAAIQKLRFLQLPEGGFGYWPGARQANNWGTSYALQFLLEAKKYGYQVPEDMIKKCVAYQYKRAESNFRAHDAGYSYASIDQAYALYTLAIAKKPNYGAMNRLRLVPSLNTTAKWLLAHSFVILGEEDIAKSIVDGSDAKVGSYRELGGNFGSAIRDQALISHTLIDMGDKVKAKVLIDEMVSKFNADESWNLSTQDRSQSLITFAHFIGNLEETEDSIKYSITAKNQFEKLDLMLDKEVDTYELDTKVVDAYDVKIKNDGNDDIYTSISLTGMELRDESAAIDSDLKMQVNYLDDGFKKISPDEIGKGSDFIIEYTITHPGLRASYENMALTAIFPSGWEILNQRLKENSNFNSGDVADYMDVRDDRVMLYFDIDKGAKKTFRFKVNATYEGRYWAPPAYCEAMYDSKISSKSKGFWATVK